ETGRRQGYYPTGRLLAMAQRISRADPILERVRPSLEELRDTTSETVVLGKLDQNDRVVYLEVLASPHPISYVGVAGSQRDIHANSLGKALLSTFDAQDRRKLLSAKPLHKHNEHTLVTLKAIEANIQASLERGWFANLGESMDDVGAIAWPVKVLGNHYAISIAGPLYRIEEHIDDKAKKLRAACRFIEQSF